MRYPKGVWGVLLILKELKRAAVRKADPRHPYPRSTPAQLARAGRAGGSAHRLAAVLREEDR